MKILLYDLETSPNLGYTWGKYEQNVIAFKKNWYILCYSYKWLEDKKVTVVALPDFKSYKRDKTDDKQLCKSLRKLMDEADVVMAHNAVSYDNKKANARFIKHGINPPSPYQTIDTLREARKHFKFNSNSLDDLGQHLGLGRKTKHQGIDLWFGCMAGVKSAWKVMKQYAAQDIVLLEKVYLKLRPWMKSHPNVNIPSGMIEACPYCGSKRISKWGFYYTKVAKRQRFTCLDCHGFSSARRMLSKVEIR